MMYTGAAVININMPRAKPAIAVVPSACFLQGYVAEWVMKLWGSP